MVSRPKGLQNGQRDFQQNSVNFLSLPNTQCGHVRLPRQSPAPALCSQVASSSGNSLQCLRSRFKARSFPLLLGKPPWTIISEWLSRLRENPQVRCQVAVPCWVGTSWWPQLVKMHERQSPVILIHPREGLFTSCLGLRMLLQTGPFFVWYYQARVTEKGSFYWKYHIIFRKDKITTEVWQSF